MKIGMVGLGKMGANMSRRLLQGGHGVVAYNRSPGPTQQLAEEGAEAAFELQELVDKLEAPRVAWVMVPAGAATEGLIQDLAELLEPGDVVIDGGNSFYQDSIRRGAWLKARELRFLDVGTSGGIWGLKEGYSMMVGGAPETVEIVRPAFETLAPGPDKGWGHLGDSGAGHFAKMVHNGIEYGLMQAYAEGFEILRGKKEFNYDLHHVAQVWRTGSVVRSWLLDLTATALEEDAELEGIEGWVADSGEGRWTVKEAIDLDVPAPVITLALQMRFVSRQDESYAAKLLAAMRNQFGGHAMKYVEPQEEPPEASPGVIGRGESGS